MSRIGYCYCIKPKESFQQDEQDIYYGSTFDKEKRWIDHCKKDNECTSKLLFENYGKDNLEMIELSNHLVNSKKELEIFESKYIRDNSCINIRVPGRNMKQYYEDNKEKLKEQRKESYKANKEKIKEYKKQKIICDCGSEIRKSDYSRHRKSKKHLEFCDNIKEI